MPTRGGAASSPLRHPGTCRSSLLSPFISSPQMLPDHREVEEKSQQGTGREQKLSTALLVQQGIAPGTVVPLAPCLARALLQAACSPWDGFEKKSIKPWR